MTYEMAGNSASGAAYRRRDGDDPDARDAHAPPRARELRHARTPRSSKRADLLRRLPRIPQDRDRGRARRRDPRLRDPDRRRPDARRRARARAAPAGNRGRAREGCVHRSTRDRHLRKGAARPDASRRGPGWSRSGSRSSGSRRRCSSRVPRSRSSTSTTSRRGASRSRTACRASRSTSLRRSSSRPSTSSPTRPGGIGAGEATVGWLLDGSTAGSLLALADLLRDGVARPRREEAIHASASEKYARGALFIRRSEQPKDVTVRLEGDRREARRRPSSRSARV